MAQQTGVKLLLEYIEQRIYKVNQLDDGSYLDKNIYLSLPKDEFEKIKEQAKAMEKEQIINSYISGDLMEGRANLIDAEQYYNETYSDGKKN
jgi:hypothetical protein